MSSSTRTSRTGAAAARPRRKAPAAAAGQATPMSGAEPESAAPAADVPDDQRRTWIAEAAYYIAERRGFSGGSPDEDWRQAETEIEQMLAGTRH
ncbi:MAG: DUF2934 domain-containing protein [Burkholderiaceae bacterium]